MLLAVCADLILQLLITPYSAKGQGIDFPRQSSMTFQIPDPSFIDAR